MKNRHAGLVVLAWFLVCFQPGCILQTDSGPVGLDSRSKIASTSRYTSRGLRISELDVKDYPALKKFSHGKRIDFDFWSASGDGGATDEKLEALADVGFTNLWCVTLRKCPRVTDRGIAALARIQSLESLALRETAMTDVGMKTLSEMKRLHGVLISKCTNVTARGLLKLVESEALVSMEFSCENLSEADVIKILSTTRRVKRCQIGFPNEKANTPAVHAVAAKMNMELFFEGKDFWYGGP